MKTHFCKLVRFFCVMWLAATGLGLNLHGQSVIQFSALTYNVTEGTPEVTIVVQRTNDLDTVVSVDFATTTNGNATAGVDYTDVATTLMFLAGETNKLVTVPVLNDGLVEAAETFQVALSNPTGGAVLGIRTNATVRITDNDKGLAFEFASYSVAEDAGSVLIGVVRGDDGDFPITVDVVSSDATAKAGQDYTGITNTLTFASGEKVELFTVPILNDSLKESAKAFRLTLSNPSGGAVGTPQTATVTVRDNDPGVEWELTKYWMQENEGNAVLTVRRGNDMELAAFTVDYTTANVTAIAGQDYEASSGTVSFAAGERQKTIVIPIIQDDLIEANETLKVALLNPNGVQMGTRQTTTVTIFDMTGMLSHHFENISVPSDRNVQMSLSGGVNPRFKDFFDLYPVETSTNLVDWSPLVALQRTNAATNTLLYVDADASKAATRFYRTPGCNLMTPLHPLRGPFAVGAVSRLLTDTTRRNRYMISTNGSFMVTVVYPAEVLPGVLPCRLNEWACPYISQDQAVYDASELTYLPKEMAMFTHAVPNSHFASAPSKCPIVVFSPGYTAPRFPQAQYLAEHIASHGYVWVSVDHADAFPTIFPDGRYIDERSAVMSVPGLQDRVRDLRFILDELAKWNLDDPLFGERLDLSRVATMGFSWGGPAAGESCRVDERCKAAINLDGGGFETAPELGRVGLQRPSLTINSPNGGDSTLFAKAVTNAIWFQVSGTTHGDFGGPSNAEVDRTCKDYILWFLNKHLKGSTDAMPALKDYPRVINFKQK